MNKLLFTKIFSVVGILVGFISAKNYGVSAIGEIIGYSLPYLIVGAVIGVALDLIQKMFSKSDKD
jgi:hypothetical protein